MKNRSQLNFDRLFANIEVQFNDDRVDFQDKGKMIPVPLNSDQTRKLHFTAKISKFNVSKDDMDEPKPIRIHINTNLSVDCEEQGLNCPVLHSSITRSERLNAEVELLSGCKSDICLCNLAPKLIEKSIESKIVVGKDELLEVNFDVANNGTEPGYGAKLNFNSNIPVRSTFSTSKVKVFGGAPGAPLGSFT